MLIIGIVNYSDKCKGKNLMNTVILRIYFSFIFLSVCQIIFSQSSKYHGIDVSHHNGKINWKTVRKTKDIQFVYMKATEGKTYTDKRYKGGEKIWPEDWFISLL